MAPERSLQDYCELYNFDCEIKSSFGVLFNNRKIYEANPEVRKPCTTGCGAMLRNIDIADHSCVAFLKSTVEKLKRETKNSESSLQQTTQNLTKEIDMLKSTIEELILKGSGYKREAYFHTVFKKEICNRDTRMAATFMIDVEKGQLVEKVRNMLMYIGNSNSAILKLHIEILRKDIGEAKARLRKEPGNPISPRWEAVSEVANKYEILQAALRPMTPDMRKEVLKEYGKWMNNYTKGDEYLLDQINKEMEGKYGGMFFSIPSAFRYVSEKVNFKKMIDPELCRIIFWPRYINISTKDSFVLNVFRT